MSLGLVAGAHRLEACKRLGWSEIPAIVSELGDHERVIAECDENLCGTKLSAVDVAIFTAKRKEAYLALHPETAHSGDRTKQDANSASCPSFADDQSDKTGVSKRTVQVNAERGQAISPAALAMVRGTKLDTGAYLDKLKKVAPDDQVARANLFPQRSPEPKLHQDRFRRF